MFSTLCLVALAAVALVLTGRLEAGVGAGVVVAVGLGAVGGWRLVSSRTALRRAIPAVLLVIRLIPRQCQACRQQRAAAFTAQVEEVPSRLALLRPSPRRWAVLLLVAVLTWLLDFADLAVSAGAALDRVPWSALVAGFLVVQASIALQVLPGGAGLAEVGLLGALLAAAVPAGPAAVTVLVYRVSSWLAPSVIGWVDYGVQAHLIRARPRRHQHLSPFGVLPGVGQA